MGQKIRFEFTGGPSFEVTRDKAIAIAATLLLAADELLAFETVAWDTKYGEAQLSATFLEKLAELQEGLRKVGG